MIQLTDNAREYLSSIANDDHITLGVKGGGCSGFTYVWDYKKNWPDVKWSDPIDDLLVLDPMAEMFVFGCTVDYAKEDVFAKVYKRIRGIVVKKPTKITAKRWIKNELLKKSKAGGVYKGRIKTTSQKFRQKQLDVTDTGSIK